MSAVTLCDQIAAVEREVKMRERVYARRIEEGKMSPAQADHEIRRMKAVLATLRDLQPAPVSVQPPLF